MNVPGQDVFVIANNHGELQLGVDYQDYGRQNVNFTYDKRILTCNDDIAALVHFFSGKNQVVTIHDCAISPLRKQQMDLSNKHIKYICDIDESISVIPQPSPLSVKKNDMHPGVIFSGGFDSLSVHYMAEEIFGNHDLLFVKFGKGYDREYMYARKFNPIVFETNWREKVPSNVRPVQPFNIPMVLMKYISDINCFFRGNTIETVMQYILPESGCLAMDDFNVNIYEPIGSLFESAVLRIVLDFMTIDEISHCMKSIANQGTEKLCRKKMMFNSLIGSQRTNYEPFEVDSPREKCVPQNEGIGRILDVIYLLKHLERNIVENVYDLSEFPKEVFDIVKNFRLTFFDRYNPLYLDNVAKNHFVEQFERNGIVKYDDVDMKEFMIVNKIAKHMVENSLLV